MKNKFVRSALGAGVPHRKHTQDMETVKMPLPSRIVLPVVQHIGAPAVPVVNKGDKVCVGTVVAKAESFVCSDIHSGVSGEVSGIETIMMPNGAEIPAIVIVPDGQQTVAESVRAPEVTDYASFVAAVKASGLVGLGGAGFPTFIKLSPKDLSQLDTLIINGAECEPYITADNREFVENGESVYAGIKLVQKYLGIKKAIIGIERNKPHAIDRMLELTKDDPDVDVKVLVSRYPQGAEKVLIEKCTGREVPEGGLPADAGALVMNVGSVAFVDAYLRTGMPLVTKRVTVDGEAVTNPQNVDVVIGTPFQEVIDFCGGFVGEPGKVLSGGPMMGTAVWDTSFPVLKQTNAILAFGEKAAHLPQMQACIRCGRCINSCPLGLSPVEITDAMKKGKLDMLAQLHTGLCIECGTCSFVCPAKRPVTQNMRLAKAMLKNGGKK